MLASELEESDRLQRQAQGDRDKAEMREREGRECIAAERGRLEKEREMLKKDQEAAERAAVEEGERIELAQRGEEEMRRAFEGAQRKIEHRDAAVRFAAEQV